MLKNFLTIFFILISTSALATTPLNSCNFEGGSGYYERWGDNNVYILSWQTDGPCVYDFNSRCFSVTQGTASGWSKAKNAVSCANRRKNPTWSIRDGRSDFWCYTGVWTKKDHNIWVCGAKAK